VCLPLAPVNDVVERTWLLVGAPNQVPPEALTAIGTMANQVTLAMRNSAVHRDLTVLAEVDGLTGLANRATFDAALARDQQGLALQETSALFVDLDDFKDVNDVHGHRAGDDLLRLVATRLRGATRPGDLCARIGGDEFAVLLARTGAAAASAVAQRVVEAVSTPADLAGAVVNVSASVGVATVVGGDDPETLVHHADAAMYAAKSAGKSRVQVFKPGLAHGELSRVTFERDLAAAAANGQLEVHYQPVVTMRDGRCTAVEALVRWRHPLLGLLQPGAFIEVAERIGAIGPIGVAVLRRAVADAVTWRDALPGAPVPVHVNVSALQLDDDVFSAAVAECLREFDWPADMLVLEFTESIVISSPQAVARLHSLAASGVQVAIDDFGTGYATLTTLRTLPVQIVKIDRSFVAGCTTAVGDRAVIEGVVAMVDRMGLHVVAEGVERPDQRDLLVSLGVSEAQGFLYLSPKPAAEFAAWLVGHLRAAEGAGGRVVIPFTPRHVT
jgi:diguanylate cyclase (GGDEF)-like protein